MSNKKRVNPRYSEEVKQDTANLVLKKGYTHQQAADSIGASKSAVKCWVNERKCHIHPDENANIKVFEENKRLKKENARLLMEREILKKAAVFFVRENQ